MSKRVRSRVMFVGEDGRAVVAHEFPTSPRGRRLSLDCPEVNGVLSRVEDELAAGMSKKAADAFVREFRDEHARVGCRVCFPTSDRPRDCRP